MDKQIVTQTFDRAFVEAALVHIQLALMACNNCVTTDSVDAKPDETHWRINNDKEIQLIVELGDKLGIKREEVIGVPELPATA